MERMKAKGQVTLAVFAAALVALFAALAVALPQQALAATIAVNQTESGHTYKAYQVLDGDVSEGANHTNVRISNVTWGSAINGENLLSALKETSKAGSKQVYAATSKGGQKSTVTLATLYKDCNSAADFAAIFDWASDNTALADTIASVINTKSYGIIKSDATSVTSTWDSSAQHYTLTINDPGYYFIGDGDSTDTTLYTDQYFMQIFNDDKSVAPKSSTPTMEKKVYENTKFDAANNEYGTSFNDTADYSIGDAVPFKLIGTIPEMSAYNNGYKYQFVDTLSTSLTRPDTSAVKVYLAKNKSDVAYSNGDFTTVSANVKDVTSQFTVTSGSNNSMTIAVNVAGSTSPAGTNDLTQVDGIYSKDESGNVITNSDGTKQRSDYKYIIVAYTATLNNSAAIGQGTISGNTLGNQSKDNSPAVGNVNVAKLEYSNNPNTPSDLSDTDNDYVIVFTYTVNLTKAAADNTETKLSGATFQLENSSGQYAKINATNHKLVGWVDAEVSGTDSDGNTTALTSAADGTFGVIGLDDGTYTLHEVSAPTGYNAAGADWTVVVSANTSNGQSGNGNETELTSIATELTGGTKAVVYGSSTLVGVTQNLVADNSVQSDVSKGTLTATITNTQGFQLPQTGDMGTLFMIAAGIVLIAGAVLIATIRRRARDVR